MDMPVITVVIIDDHALVRHGIGRLLHNHKDIQLVGQASSGNEGVQLVRELRPKVVLLDFKLPDISGLEVTNRLLRLDDKLKILVLTSESVESLSIRLLEAGVKGYLTKDGSREELVRAIKLVNTGQHMISPRIAGRLALAKIDRKTSAIFGGLTDREMEVLLMVVRGIPVEDIAERLFLSPKTVHSYRSRLFEKLGVENDVALTLLSIHEKVIAVEEADTFRDMTVKEE
jgi:two-component system, NarL family, invasion response regulator UvrY